MSTGPSKEELKNYWESSRQYFDELARYYKEADPAYYKEYIAPFYWNPLYAVSGKRQGGKAVLVLTAAIFIMVIGAAAVFLFLQTGSIPEKEVPEEKIEPSKKRVTVPDTPDTNYQVGIRYFNEKDYDNAEKYFRRVKSSDPNYVDARKKLNEIRKIKRQELEEELNKDNRRQRPVQPRR
jgi:tetratricopeptide (TPR) repeat protein